MKTITNLINEEINDINSHKDNYDPAYLSEKLITLSVLYSNLTSHLADMDSAYYKLLQLTLDTYPNEKYNRIEAKVRASEEWLKLKKAQGLEKSLIECIRSIKKYIKIKTNEQESSNY